MLSDVKCPGLKSADTPPVWAYSTASTALVIPASWVPLFVWLLTFLVKEYVFHEWLRKSLVKINSFPLLLACCQEALNKISVVVLIIFIFFFMISRSSSILTSKTEKSELYKNCWKATDLATSSGISKPWEHMLSFTSHIYLRESSSADTFALPLIRPSLPSDTSSENYLSHSVSAKSLSTPPMLSRSQWVSWQQHLLSLQRQ